jgi:predicted phosphohydrolase
MLYALGDTHLSLSASKPMDIFGGNWNGYMEKLRTGLAVLSDDDVLVLCGDTSWAMRLADALEDLRFICQFPGRKFLLKGNHDYWWDTVTKMKKFFADNGLDSLNILHNNSFEYNGVAICGTRGWFYEEENGSALDRKMFFRELGRLETSLKAAEPGLPRYAFVHYPPIYRDYVCNEVLELFRQYGVVKCYYGHIHGNGHRGAFEGMYNGTEFTMVSSDWLNFKPIAVY